MLVDDEVADEKTQARPGATRLGGVKRIKDLGYTVGGDAFARVGKTDAKSLLAIASHWL